MGNEKEEPVAMSDLSPESREVVRITRCEVAAGKYSDTDNGGHDRVIVAQMAQYLLGIAYEEE